MQKACGLFFLLFLAGSVFAQTVGSKTTPAKPSATEIEATTKDGRAVVLSSNGTWRYGKIVSTPTASNSSGKINPEVTLTLSEGNTKPVTRTAFYLLADKIENIIGTPKLFELYKRDVVRSNLLISLVDTKDVDNLVGGAFQNQILYPTYSPAAIEAFKKAIKYRAATDSKGKAVFRNVPPGQYILFGITPTPASFAYWNLEVNLNSNSLRIELSKKNSARFY